MINYIVYGSSILDSDCEALVCPVNCIGVAGAGLAKAFAIAYPGILPEYASICENGKLTIGSVHTTVTDTGKLIVFFPTKTTWRLPSKIEYITSGMEALVRQMSPPYNDKASIAIPALGCGLGGLDSSEVIPIITSYMRPIANNRLVEIYTH